MSFVGKAARCAALAIACTTLFACGSGSEKKQAPTAPPEAPAPPAPARPAPAVPAPPAAAPAPNAAAPAANTAANSATGVPASLGSGDPTKGAPQYAALCASCHGPKGCGDGPLAATLNPKPAKHCDGNVMNPLTDAFLFKTIKEGGAAVGKSPLMAPWGGTLSDAQIVDVVAYVRTLASPPYKKQG
jgi:mono/diheme cytochrome c family protein